MGHGYLENVMTTRVLVADDMRDVRTLVSRALARRKIRCDLAENGLEAERLLRENAYSLALIDLRMPEKNGHRIIVELLTQKERPIIIAMTGVDDERIMSDLYERGVDDIMLKPFSYDFLGTKVAALLKQGRRRGSVEIGDFSQQIESTTAALKSQLENVQETFHRTIEQLERQRDQLEAGYIDSVRVLTGLIDQTGKVKGSHVVRVEKRALALAEKCGVDRNTTHALKVAALLHDIGQFGMPDSIRSLPPWQLKGEDAEAYRHYPSIGATLLSEIRGADNVVEIIEAHAENYDGSGFPHRLRGKDIPLGARVLRIADACDTQLMFTSEGDRKEILWALLTKNRGRYFDPDLVDEELDIIANEKKDNDNEPTKMLSTELLSEGQVLAENLYDQHGRFLARDGAVLSQRLLRHLRAFLPGRSVKVKATTTGSAGLSARQGV